MDYIELIKIRVISFAYQLATAIAALVAAYLLSSDFAALVQEHFGTVAASLVSLVIPEIVKHLRNVRVVKGWRLGGGNQFRKPTLI